MPRFLKSKPPADISTPTPLPELVKDLASRRDSRTLAATSAVILSLGSALCDTSDTSSAGVAVQEDDAVWKTAYGAARMAVEIAKETSDALPPLKAVVGAMSILIKNFDVSVSLSQAENLILTFFFHQQTSDNAESVKEIERRVKSLSSTLTSAVSGDDYAEKARRLELRRFVPV